MSETDSITLALKPLDTMFFRNGRPFDSGEDTWADGMFPPPPSVLYGALRTWILQHDDKVTVDNILSETEDLKLKQYYLKYDGRELFPCPADIVERKDKEKGPKADEKQAIRLPFTELGDEVVVPESKAIAYPYNSEKNSFEVEAIDGFFELSDLLRYLNQKNEAGYIITQPKWPLEPKVGIGRENDSHTTETGKLYRVGMQRVACMKKTTEIIIHAQGGKLNLPKKGLMKLGGEGKQVQVESVESGRIKKATQLKINTRIKTDRLLVYLATPASIEGEYPSLNNLEGLPQSHFYGTATKKLTEIGGFDVKERQPKPMVKVVPAGSVFFYKLETAIEVDAFQGLSVSDQLGEQGFGIAYFGTF